MWMLDGWMFLGLYGIPYLTIAGAAFALAGRFSAFVIGRYEGAALLFPLALYLFLTFAVEDRQGFHWGYANLVMAAPAVMAVIAATRSRPAYWACIAATTIAGIAAWLLIPKQGLTRLF